MGRRSVRMASQWRSARGADSRTDNSPAAPPQPRPARSASRLAGTTWRAKTILRETGTKRRQRGPAAPTASSARVGRPCPDRGAETDLQYRACAPPPPVSLARGDRRTSPCARPSAGAGVLLLIPPPALRFRVLLDAVANGGEVHVVVVRVAGAALEDDEARRLVHVALGHGHGQLLDTARSTAL